MDEYDILVDKLHARGVDVERVVARLKAQQIETPSWGYADSGTRFGVFPQPGAAVTIFEKLEDAAQVHRSTRVAPLVATRSSLVSFVVLLAAPGIPGEELVLLQAKLSLQAMGAHDKQVAAFEDLQRTILQLVKSTPEEKVLRAKLTELMKDAIAEAPESERAMFANPEQMVDAQMKRVSSPWYRWLLAFDPQPFLRKVNVPVLALNGTKDVQVPAKENLAGIRAASPSAKIIEIANVNHLLQTAPTGAMSEYATIEETIAPAVLEVVGDWIVSLE